jgi:hypothetical protein
MLIRIHGYQGVYESPVAGAAAVEAGDDDPPSALLLKLPRPPRPPRPPRSVPRPPLAPPRPRPPLPPSLSLAPPPLRYPACGALELFPPLVLPQLPAPPRLDVNSLLSRDWKILTSGRPRSSTERDFMSSGKWVRVASRSSTVLKCATLLEAPHFSIFVILARSSSLKSSLTASSVDTFIMNKPIIESEGGLETGDEASAPFVAVPFVAGVGAFSFSLLPGPGKLTTLVWAG